MIIPTVAALAGVAVRGIAVVELLVRLRWQERRQYAQRSYFTALVCVLPRDWRLDEVRAEASELRLVIAYEAEATERPSR